MDSQQQFVRGDAPGRSAAGSAAVVRSVDPLNPPPPHPCTDTLSGTFAVPGCKARVAVPITLEWNSALLAVALVIGASILLQALLCVIVARKRFA